MEVEGGGARGRREEVAGGGGGRRTREVEGDSGGRCREEVDGCGARWSDGEKGGVGSRWREEVEEGGGGRRWRRWREQVGGDGDRRWKEEREGGRRKWRRGVSFAWVWRLARGLPVDRVVNPWKASTLLQREGGGVNGIERGVRERGRGGSEGEMEFERGIEGGERDGCKEMREEEMRGGREVR